MKKLTTTALSAMVSVAVLGTLPVATAAADEVRVPVMSQADRNSQVKMPRTGQSQSSVRSQFGDPRETRGPVGDPPITQWHYDSFVVYFEYDHVIHTVLKPNR